MSDLIKVTVTEQPITVTVDTETPTVTITDNTTSKVSVADASGDFSTVITEDQPTVTVNLGGGGITDRSALLATLAGYITTAQLSSTLQADLTELRSLWARVGTALNLLTADEGTNIQEVARTYTDDTIEDAVLKITTTTDGLTADLSTVTQTASEIQQSVIEYKADTDGNFTAQASLIDQNASSITDMVQQVTALGDTTEALQSSVTVNATSISQEVSARTELAGQVISAQSLIAQLSDSISLAVTSVSDLTSRMSAAEVVLGDDGINLSVLQSTLGDASYAIETLQTILSNQWGVSITEEVGGSTYATGFQSILHPSWITDSEYEVDDTIYYDDIVYTCILAHTASVANNPGSDAAATYWEATDNSKTEFAVQADSFYIKTSDGLTPLFSTNESKTEINTDLIINGVTQIIGDTDDFYWIGSSGMSVDQNNQIFVKETSTTAWDESVCSSLPITNGVKIQFNVTSDSGVHLMMGFSVDPTINHSFTNLDYALYAHPINGIQIYESGSPILFGVGTRTSSTLLEIVYDGADIVYSVDGTEVRRIINVGADLTFYANSTFYNSSGECRVITFEPYNNGYWDSQNKTIIDGSKLTLISGDKITELDGGKLVTGTVTADAIGTNTIIASSANIGTGVITSANIADATIATADIANLAVTNAKIANLAVDTLKIANQAVTIPVSAYTSGSTTLSVGSWTTLQTATITSTGAPILITASAKFSAGLGIIYMRLLRASTTLMSVDYVTITGQDAVLTLTYKDVPGFGSATYTLQAYTHNTGNSYFNTNITAANRVITLLEVKK